MTYGVTTQRCPGVYVTRQHNITLSVRVVGRDELQSYAPQWGELGSVESIAVVPENVVRRQHGSGSGVGTCDPNETRQLLRTSVKTILAYLHVSSSLARQCLVWVIPFS